METKIGVISSIKQSIGIGKNGKPYKRWVFEIGGNNFSTFDSKIGEAGFAIGDNVEMVGEQNGQFFNMLTLKKSSAAPTVEVKAVAITESPKAQEIVDLLKAILDELKSYDLNRTIFGKVETKAIPSEDIKDM